jgi:hypothetical protein
MGTFYLPLVSSTLIMLWRQVPTDFPTHYPTGSWAPPTMSPFTTEACNELIKVIKSECADVEQHAEDCVGECKDLLEKAVRDKCSTFFWCSTG